MSPVRSHGDLVEGLGIPGIPHGGVVTVQGDDGVGGYSVPVYMPSGEPQIGTGMYEWDPPITAWIRKRVVTDVATLLPSAVRTAGVYSGVTNYTGKGVRVFLNITAIAPTGGVLINIYGVDSLTGGAFVGGVLLQSAVYAAVGLYMLTIYPGMTAVANLVANNVVGRDFSVQTVHSNGVNITYSLSYQIIP